MKIDKHLWRIKKNDNDQENDKSNFIKLKKIPTDTNMINTCVKPKDCEIKLQFSKSNSVFIIC